MICDSCRCKKCTNFDKCNLEIESYTCEECKNENYKYIVLSCKRFKLK